MYIFPKDFHYKSIEYIIYTVKFNILHYAAILK